MSRARHKRASGGRADFYTGAGSNVAKEAEEKKHGGRVKDMGAVKGTKSKARMDKRARGGRIGSDKSPFTSAAKVGGGLGVPD